MILTSLNNLYDRLSQDPSYAIAPDGYSLQKISFCVVVDLQGNLCQIDDMRIQSGRKFIPQQILVPGNTKQSGSGLNPCFLWDTPPYMLGFKKDDDKPERTQAAFESFKQRHLQIEQEISDDAFSAVCRFLNNWNPQNATNYPLLIELESGYGVFRLQGEMGDSSYIHNSPKVSQWWQTYHTSQEVTAQGMCLISGEIRPIAKLHSKIKGVRDAQSAGAPLVSFNADAYESYSKEQSLNSPVSEIASFRYGTALNALTDGPKKLKHKLQIGDATTVFWTETPTLVEDVFAAFIEKGDTPAQEQSPMDEALLNKLKSFCQTLQQGGGFYEELGDPKTPFYLLGLSPNAGRISVRFWHIGTLGHLIQNIQLHHTHLNIVKSHQDKDPSLPPVWMLLKQTARESKDIPPLLSGALIRSILTGCPYPQGFYTAIINRIRADRDINYLRASIIKAFLTRNHNKEIPIMLDENNQEPAYRLGRLFATLEKTQEDALPGINATIRDRFYSSASATPGTVFPRLLRTYQHHLAKLEGGQKVNRERLVQEVLEPLGTFPSFFDLEAQGLFALGYYHQRKHFFTKKSE